MCNRASDAVGRANAACFVDRKQRMPRGPDQRTLGDISLLTNGSGNIPSVPGFSPVSPGAQQGTGAPTT